ncbi:MAG: hypothetical protein A3G35_01090 [candidate division NC10 bacterium RIFCSPLOWO2_12_FULL_66_18]|nr:MAG: hypothetical protein A3G35_01090 [candidate division NC10 bacterium RIFCSPLOWO2_12_FULL_66_18]
MNKEEKEGSSGETEAVEGTDIHDEDFQFVLREFLSVYQPILEEDLKRAKAPEQLKEEAEKTPVSCDDELALANRIFGKFFTEEVAVRLLPTEGRRQLGAIERWRWCLLHVRCCMIFGWLVCRGPRTFRAFAYYLYQYWLCVRQVLGTPVGSPPTAEQRQDFRTLVQALAGAYKPYLTDQLATVEFPAGIPDEVLTGKIDCFEGEEEATAVFERFLTVETAPALLGKEAFAAHSKEPFFWFCRCWCLCAIRFGCCLARARSFIEVLRCLLFYRRCLRECFRPLRCEITKPTGCTEEELNQTVGGLTVTVVGTAAGAFFDHYTLEWRKVEGAACDDDAGWKSDGVVYPGGAATGTSPVVSGLLGWINTTVLAPGSYEVRLCVYSSQPGVPPQCCCIQFNLFKRLVWIERVGSAPVQTPPGPFVSTAPIVNTNPGGVVVPVGCCVTVKGSAFVGDCNDRRIKCFDLRYGLGFLPGPGEPGFNPADYFGSLLVPTGPVCYTDPDESGKRAPWNQVIGRALTTRLVQTEIDLFGTKIKVWKLQDFCFDSASLLPPCPDLHHHCRSGKYTLLLDVEDTLGTHYYDTQHVWFDNKPIHVEFGGLEGLPGCEDLGLQKFVPAGAPCNVAWPINLLGIAYDEYIDYTDLTYPSDNFDYYSLWITRQAGPTYTVPITPDLVTLGPGPFKGTQRVGDPGTRCETAIPGCPPPAFPAKFYNLLTKLDLRIFDAVCAASLAAPFAPPAGFALERGKCCGYTFQLYAQDKTWTDGGPGLCHRKWSLPWAVCICNDVDGRVVK